MSADQLQLHRSSIAAASTYVARVTDDDLGRPTPCSAWNLGQLLDHMVSQHLGFAAVVRDGAAEPDAYRPVPFTLAAWQASVDSLLDAFAGADLQARVVEVELHPTLPLPIGVLVGAQLLDTVVHTWDIAATLGDTYEPDPQTADVVLRIAEPIPDDDSRDRPGAAFAHALAPGPTPWARTLALLGRDVGWHR
ncbi:MAG: TIGR03086 family metal-binding protein [Ilumatobacteraceae bacterium]